MHSAAHAYAKIAQATQSPRELEATVLMKAASRLQGIMDDWDGRRSDLDDALTYNRKLWTVLVTSVTREDNPLPVEIKRNITTLGMFIFNRTIQLTVEPKAEGIRPLVRINREIAAGLRGMGTDQAPASA
jgi:flagellar protein FlaF